LFGSVEHRPGREGADDESFGVIRMIEPDLDFVQGGAHGPGVFSFADDRGRPEWAGSMLGVDRFASVSQAGESVKERYRHRGPLLGSECLSQF